MTSIIVGIDPGVHTGFATWDMSAKRLESVMSVQIHDAMDRVRNLRDAGMLRCVVFEDARQRTWFGAADARQQKSGAGVREGVGSVKRDCTIWQDFLTSLGVPFEAVKPMKGATKLDAKQFKAITKWHGTTNNHGRDAAMLIIGRM